MDDALIVSAWLMASAVMFFVCNWIEEKEWREWRERWENKDD